MELNKENVKKIIGILAFGIIFYFILQNIVAVKNAINTIIDILFPFLFGAGLAFVLNIPLNMFERKLFKPKKMKNGKIRQNKLKRPICILLSIILVIFIISFIIKLVIPQLISVIYMFISDVPELAYNIKEYAIELTKQYPDVSDQIKNIEIDWNKVASDIVNFITGLGKNIITSSIGAIVSLIGGLFNTIVSIVFAIYILISKERLACQAEKFVKAYCSEEKTNYILEITSLSKNTFNKFITGQCTEAIILGLLCFFGMLILRLPFATTIGILVGVTALIPIVGAFIGIIIGAILILSISSVKAVIFIVFLIILQQFESNVIYPKVVGESIGLPGMWVLLAVTIGGSLGGMLGLLLGVPFVSVLYTILKNDINKRLHLKQKEEENNAN